MFPRRFHNRIHNRFHNRYRRRNFFPFWIFIVLFFVFMGKSGWWLLFPIFLFWCFGPMFWGITTGSHKWEEQPEWKNHRNPIPPQWQSSQQPKPAPHESAVPARVTPVGQPLRSLAGIPNTCASCGGPVNSTTVEWRNNNLPHCGYCGTKLQ